MQRTLQESGMQVEHLCVELSGVHSSSSTSESQSCMKTISRDDVSDIYHLMEDPRVMVGHEEHTGL
jgi:hypothetical protein